MAGKPDGLKVTRSEISQTIDLKKWTGKDLENDPGLRREIGQAVIDYIVERSESGIGLGGTAFKKNRYSESYQDSLAYKAAGKTSAPVTMELSGDMLGGIDLDDSSPQIKMFIVEDQLDKAHGHMTGQEGKGPLPKREFFGITEAEFKKNILPQFKNQIENARTERGRDSQGEALRTFRGSDLFTEDDE